MQASLSIVLLLVLVAVVHNQNVEFETAKPVKDCEPKDFPPNAKTKYRFYLTKFVISPPCGEEYCVVKKGMQLEISGVATPIRDAKVGHIKFYEEKVTEIVSDVLQVSDATKDTPLAAARVHFYTENVCEIQKRFNITCPFKAKIPLYEYFKDKLPDIPAFPQAKEFTAVLHFEDEEQNILMCYKAKIKNEYYPVD